MLTETATTGTTSTADAAVGYLERGWGVFPVRQSERGDPSRCTCSDPKCPNAGKHPLGLWTQGGTRHLRSPGYLSRTEFLDSARRVWSKGRERGSERRGIGCNLCASELLVIDLDSDAAVDAWFAGPFGMLRTFAVRTGHGLHLYFRQSWGWDAEHLRSVPQGAMTRAHGTVKTEVKGCGGYTVLPPSLHRTGKRYTVLDDVPVLWLPDGLRSWIAAAGGRGPRLSGADIGAHRRVAGLTAEVRNPPGLARWAVRRIADAAPGDRNEACKDGALALARVAETGWCTAQDAAVLFLDACRDQRPVSVLVDELDKTTDLWERLGPR